MKVLSFFCVLASSTAFVPLSPVDRADSSLMALVSRRHLLEHVSIAGVLLHQEFAFASGGATAGGPYLLSAKQRYNDRVKTSMKVFLGLKKSLEDGSLDEIKAYFSSEDVGGWKDGSTAGYLLANAFRRNSTASPDSLPAVKKWKAFAAEIETIMKTFKKKDAAKTLAAYDKALPALDEYLEIVELPPATEL